MKVSTGTSQPTSVTREAGGGEHAADDRLADLVDVAGHGAGHGHAEALALAAGGVEGRLQDGHGGLHGLGPLDQLGEEELAAPEEVADLLDALDEPEVEDVAGGEAGVEALLREALGVLDLAVDDGLLHLVVQVRHGVLLRTSTPTAPATPGRRTREATTTSGYGARPPPAHTFRTQATGIAQSRASARPRRGRPATAPGVLAMVRKSLSFRLRAPQNR